MIILDRCNGSCNILDEPSGRVYVPNKTENVNLNVITKNKCMKNISKTYFM